MFRRPIREINAEYQANEQYLPSILNMVREACINAGLARKDVQAVALAIEEGISNIIRHAYLYEKGNIRIRIVFYKRRIIFSLIDNGRSFDPDGGQKLDLEKLVDSGRKGGLGFYMINKIMDSVEYLSAPGYNELRMTKLVSRQPEKTRLFMGRMFTLRVKFSVYTFLIMLTIIAGAYIIIDNRTTSNIYRHLHQTIVSLSKTITDQARGYVLNRRSDVEFDELVRSYLRANPELLMVVLTDSTGFIMADSRDIKNLHKKYVPPFPIDYDTVTEAVLFPDDDKRLYYLIQPMHSGDRIIGHAHISYTGALLANLVAVERHKILALTIIGLAIGIGGIYLLSNYFVSPIIRITERVRKFSSGDIETELPPEGVEEYFEISKALNEMMSRLRRDRENIIEREKVAKELEVAGEIQRTLLPGKLPEIPGLKLDAFYRAASRISGDLYDVFQVDEKKYCLLVADVSGKGIPASLVMSMLRTIIRISAKGKKNAHDILVTVNDHIKDNIPPGIFITAFLGVYSVDTREFNFVSAGHNPLVYVKNNNKEVVLINPPGMPLGLPCTNDHDFADKLKQQFLRIHDKDVLFIYTDGITESMNRLGEKYGLERLLSLFDEQVRTDSFRDPAQISELILNDVDRHSGMATQADDITFITMISCDETRPGYSGQAEIKKPA
jgi:serine phosphatase RsbU (regulator of sigma subunit)/anti-sigma regulatory factor (Ser/Thr protein kinase)